MLEGCVFRTQINVLMLTTFLLTTTFNNVHLYASPLHKMRPSSFWVSLDFE